MDEASNRNDGKYKLAWIVFGCWLMFLLILAILRKFGY